MEFNNNLVLLILCLIVVIQLNYVFCQQQNISVNKKKILDSIIDNKIYDPRIRPSGVNASNLFGSPSIVRTNIFLRNINKINDVDMDYSVQLTFRAQWVDSRLKFNDTKNEIKYLVASDGKIWKPDFFFPNEKHSQFHSMIMPNVLQRIYPNGTILFSIRITLVLSCPMNFRYFPFDRQICSIKVASYGYTIEDLVFLWKEDDPIQVNKNLNHPKFRFEKYSTPYCSSITNTGEYSCLKVNLQLKREFSNYLIQIYIPCLMLILISWLSFWLDSNAIQARVFLVVATLMTMTVLIFLINSSLPSVSYTKAIDIWTGVCLTFVCGALIEIVLVNYISQCDAHRRALKQQKDQRKAQLATFDSDILDDESAGLAMKSLVHQNGDKEKLKENHISIEKKNWFKIWLSKYPTNSRIDAISRMLFPFMFAVFNVIYWVIICCATI